MLKGRDERRKALREQLGALQAIAYNIELNDEKEARRVQVSTLRAIRVQDRDGRRKARQEQVGTLKSIVHNMELNEEKQDR